jgi:hypothetical protein
MNNASFRSLLGTKSVKPERECYQLSAIPEGEIQCITYRSTNMSRYEILRIYLLHGKSNYLQLLLWLAPIALLMNMHSSASAALC